MCTPGLYTENIFQSKYKALRLSSKHLEYRFTVDVSIVYITGHGAWTWQKGALSMETRIHLHAD